MALQQASESHDEQQHHQQEQECKSNILYSKQSFNYILINCIKFFFFVASNKSSSTTSTSNNNDSTPKQNTVTNHNVNELLLKIIKSN